MHDDFFEVHVVGYDSCHMKYFVTILKNLNCNYYIVTVSVTCVLCCRRIDQYIYLPNKIKIRIENECAQFPQLNQLRGISYFYLNSGSLLHFV